ncbi:hypothetical protein QE152_g29108 [Popillia japonica]|uniref:Endonuclease/exonuclease/phosphatase domain-containing protein n=1 Tax=Popillia japonica TaxID=7064 RepID=A0AAW1JIJ9_POPJA
MPSIACGGNIFSDILDIAITKNLSVNIQVEATAEVSSDHNPIIIRLGGAADVLGSALQRFVNWPKFEREVAVCLPDFPESIETTTDLEAAPCKLTQGISGCLVEATSYRAPVTDRWLPGHIRALVREKRSARRRAQQMASRTYQSPNPGKAPY